VVLVLADAVVLVLADAVVLVVGAAAVVLVVGAAAVVVIVGAAAVVVLVVGAAAVVVVVGAAGVLMLSVEVRADARGEKAAMARMLAATARSSSLTRSLSMFACHRLGPCRPSPGEVYPGLERRNRVNADKIS
jgi:hypothetical protein